MVWGSTLSSSDAELARGFQDLRSRDDRSYYSVVASDIVNVRMICEAGKG
jgi:hypothetical protein